MNIKYEYFCNSEHKTSNMKLETCNMKYERKHEMGEKIKISGYLKNNYMKH